MASCLGSHSGAEQVIRCQNILVYALLLAFSPHLTSASPLNFFSSKPLYGPEDKVFLLNATTIREHIFNSEKVWLVEFFSSWCGHCVNFAPRWIKFADDLYDWREVAVVAAIDCADENNTPTCREFNIMGYPTIRLFPPGSPPLVEASEREKTKGIDKSVNKGLDVQKTESMEKLKRNFIDDLAKYYPNLLNASHHKGSSFTELWTKTEFRYGIYPTFLLVIYESDSSHVGQEVALKLSKYKAIKVYRFNSKNPVYSQLELEGWPAAGYIADDGTSGSISLGNDNIIDVLVNSAVSLAHIPKSELPLAGIKQDLEGPPEEVHANDDSVIASSRDVVSMDDLLHAIRDLLHKELGLVRVFTRQQMQSLKALVHVLNVLFPADRREVKIFFEKLDEWLLSKTEVESSEFLAKLEQLELELHPWDIDLSRWDECQGTVAGRRGYTCGLWRLFHTLTIVGVQKNTNLKVLEAIYGFVREFFGCRECKEHFASMVHRDKILSVDSIMTQALWLWKAHNEVNLRLKGAPSEDPGFPKQKYPSKVQCSECYESAGNNGDGPFDEGKVMEYLLKIYSHPQRSAVPHVAGNDLLDQQLLPQTNAGGKSAGASSSALMSEQVVKHNYKNINSSNHAKARTSSWFGFFSIADIGLFMIVYLSVAFLLLLGYVHFKMVGRRRFSPALLVRKMCTQSIV